MASYLWPPTSGLRLVATDKCPPIFCYGLLLLVALAAASVAREAEAVLALAVVTVAVLTLYATVAVLLA